MVDTETYDGTDQWVNATNYREVREEPGNVIALFSGIMPEIKTQIFVRKNGNDCSKRHQKKRDDAEEECFDRF